MTFSGPSVAYKLNYSHYCLRRYFSPYTARIDLAVTTYINLAATTSINLVAICYCPPYCGVARL